MNARIPDPPAGLIPRGPGRRLWREVLAEYDPAVDEMILLEQACKTLDDLSRLEAELSDAPTVVEGSMGQRRVNGLYSELRGHRLALTRLLAGLGLGDGSGGKRSSSEAGRKMALVRWQGRGANAS